MKTLISKKMPDCISPNTGAKQPHPPGRRPCPFCKSGMKNIHWADFPTLKGFTDYFGNIKKRFYTGVCVRHQKDLRRAVERARFMGLLAYRK